MSLWYIYEPFGKLVLDRYFVISHCHNSPIIVTIFVCRRISHHLFHTAALMKIHAKKNRGTRTYCSSAALFPHIKREGPLSGHGDQHRPHRPSHRNPAPNQPPPPLPRVKYKVISTTVSLFGLLCEGLRVAKILLCYRATVGRVWNRFLGPWRPLI